VDPGQILSGPETEQGRSVIVTGMEHEEVQPFLVIFDVTV
jgi:hypothetical protein